MPSLPERGVHWASADKPSQSEADASEPEWMRPHTLLMAERSLELLFQVLSAPPEASPCTVPSAPKPQTLLSVPVLCLLPSPLQPVPALCPLSHHPSPCSSLKCRWLTSAPWTGLTLAVLCVTEANKGAKGGSTPYCLPSSPTSRSRVSTGEAWIPQQLSRLPGARPREQKTQRQTPRS